jgi:5-methylcytosine-specific restriction endonuclease McrA
MDVKTNLDRTALRVAERVIQLLDEGSFTSTYKYAVLVGLMDLCMEQTTATGAPPTSITTRELAEKVIELYWPQCAPYVRHDQCKDRDEKRGVLRQNHGRGETQAEIVRRIEKFRSLVDADAKGGATMPLSLARAHARADAYEKLVRFVEWKLVEMPLPRLQCIGRDEDRFLYLHDIPKHMEDPGPFRKYQAGEASDFNNLLTLKEGVGEAFIALNGVLRPLIHRQWAMMVARMNRLEEALLEEFLFGPTRIALDPVRPKLRELQGGKCFYCDKPLSGGKYHVDHFIPWARHPDNGIHNLVAADESCNSRKRDYLAAAEHVERWRERTKEREADLEQIAKETSWEYGGERTLGVARVIYMSLPEDTRLWQRGEDFVLNEPSRITAALR